MTAPAEVKGRAGRSRGPLISRWGTLAFPLLVFLTVAFLLPMLLMVIRSFTDPPDAGLANYQTFFASDANIRVLGNTFYIATVCTIVCLVVGYPYAYLMAIVPQRVAGLLLIAVLVPFWSSLLVRTFAWEVILRDTGLINNVLRGLGIISEPLPLIRNTFSVILGMSQILLPFMVLPLYTVMQRIDPELTRAAANLGAPPFAAFRRVFVPLSFPGVAAGALLVFVLALGFYITPTILGSPRETMISRFIADQVQQRLNWGLATAMAVILMGLTFAVLAIASRFVKLQDVYGALGEEA
ncbi:MAG: ABC transporter permease [Chloroflexi bacterium]|nr:ABC transporter permease [Chloroflexota bacterium]